MLKDAAISLTTRNAIASIFWWSIARSPSKGALPGWEMSIAGAT
jgi:hypothetical protein